MIDPKQYNSKIMGSAQESKIFDGNKCFNLYGQTRIEIRRYAQKDLLIVPLGSGTERYLCHFMKSAGNTKTLSFFEQEFWQNSQSFEVLWTRLYGVSKALLSSQSNGKSPPSTMIALGQWVPNNESMIVGHQGRYPDMSIGTTAVALQIWGKLSHNYIEHHVHNSASVNALHLYRHDCVHFLYTMCQ